MLLSAHLGEGGLLAVGLVLGALEGGDRAQAVHQHCAIQQLPCLLPACLSGETLVKACMMERGLPQGKLRGLRVARSCRPPACSLPMEGCEEKSQRIHL